MAVDTYWLVMGNKHRRRSRQTMKKGRGLDTEYLRTTVKGGVGLVQSEKWVEVNSCYLRDR